MINTSKHIINIVKHRVLWMWVTFVLLLPGTVAMIYSTVVTPEHSPLKLGIDYTGGTLLQYDVKRVAKSDEITKLTETLKANGIEQPSIQQINVPAKDSVTPAKDLVVVRTKFIDEKDVTTANKVTTTVQSVFDGSELVSTNSVGPSLGKELFSNSLVALLLACLGIVAYLTLRFKLDFAICAILALIHDVLFVLGIFSILGLFCNVQIDGLFITAMLTVLGFSVHDTIVVFDRIRENLKIYAKKMSFGEIVNASVNQTIARSINTSVTTLLTLFALYFLGGVSTKNFVLVMILGIAIGTYSSIFFASMLIDFWRERKQVKA